MLEFSGIGMTDEINLYNQKFALDGLYSAYEQIWDEGVPSFFNHDHRKHLGWTKLSGIYLEPHKAYLTNTIYVGENEDEHEKLKYKSYNYLYKKHVDENRDKYDELKQKLGDFLSNSANPRWVNAVSFEDEGIVKRVIPDILVHIDKDGLIPENELTYIQPGIYEKNGWLIFAHRFFRRGLSYLNTLNEPFLELLHKQNDNLNFKIAIDMDCIGLLGTQQHEFEYQYWWGPKFNDNLDEIKPGVTVYENEHYDGLLSDTLKTEFGWYTQDNKKTFECEEITDIENISRSNEKLYGCRFIHSMLDETSGTPCHLDGAIRIYTDEKLLRRLDVNIKNSGRNTEYQKIWRVDGDISIPLWKELITHYYRDNMQIGEYFNGVDEKINQVHTEKTNELQTCDEKNTLKEFIPVTISAGNGLRVNIFCDHLEDCKDANDIKIRPYQFYIDSTGRNKFIESDSITIYKALINQGLSVRMPFCQNVATEDMIYNFPIFVCKNNEIAEAVIQTFNNFCVAWNSNNDDRIISYSLKINYNTKSIVLSFAGHIKDFIKWYGSTKYHVPVDEDGVAIWLKETYDFLNTYTPANNNPCLSVLKTKGGFLSFPKKFIPKRYIEKIVDEEKGLYVKLKLSKDEIDIVTKNNISACAMFKVNNSTCSVCGKDYSTCSCQKFLNPNVTEKISKSKLLGLVWTNRSAIPEKF